MPAREKKNLPQQLSTKHILIYKLPTMTTTPTSILPQQNGSSLISFLFSPLLSVVCVCLPEHFITQHTYTLNCFVCQRCWSLNMTFSILMKPLFDCASLRQTIYFMSFFFVASARKKNLCF